jgi:8-oxo-dGTP diphosphatase
MLFFNTLYRVALRLLYRMHLTYCFLVRPSTQGVYVAIWVGDSVLMVKNSYKSEFTLPCGGIHRHESPLDAARRELYEEVGIYAREGDLVTVGDFVNESEFKRDMVRIYEMHLDEEPRWLVDQREVTWAGLMSVQQACSLPVFPVVHRYLWSKVAAGWVA